MAEEAQDTNWSQPKYYFLVDWDSLTNIPFQEISGLNNDDQQIEYRHGNSPGFSVIKMPGIIKDSTITMKKGVFTNDNLFRDWYNKIRMNTVERENVVVKLLDEGGNPVMTWTLLNAWPTKISLTDLNSDVNEVAVDTIVIMHEGITIRNG